MNRKFTHKEVQIFNQRVKALRSNIPLESRKWIYNPNIETEAEFDRRRKLNLTAPWEDVNIKD
jgi:predicted adenine nucleotide alpha hydrolase (AANH) superfamily ATPase